MDTSLDQVPLANRWWLLTWRDVDPSGRDFDAAAASAVIRALGPASRVPGPGTDWRLESIWFDELTAALVERYGQWAVGWEYSVAVQDVPGRGEVPVWRCERPPLATSGEVLDGVARGLAAWHELLVELATDSRGRFATLPAHGTHDRGPRAWRAVREHPGRIVRHHPLPDPPVPHPSLLTWADVDQSSHEFDPATVPAVVGELLPASDVPSSGADWRLIDLWQEGVTVALVERYGEWAVGWRWAVGEGDLDGGVVTAWCCREHSMTTPEQTLARVAAALVEWHGWLVELAERFDRFLPLPHDALTGWERAVVHLVTVVGERTRYESGWHSSCRTVLRWFLSAAGVEETRHEELMTYAIGGRFSSWIEPSPDTVRSVADRLAERVIGAGP